MEILCQKRSKVAISAFILICCSQLFSIQLPVYLRWRSSNSYFYYEVSDTETSRIKQAYKINIGLDTLFTSGVRTNIELTNQDEQLGSQILVKQALIDYRHNDYAIQTSMKDFGYGNGFFLNNRRNDDITFNENVLVNYRWHGLQSTYFFGNNSIRAGFAGNEINRFLCEISYAYHDDNKAVTLFGVYSHNENQYSIPAIDNGVELNLTTDRFKFRADFDYHYIPKSKHFQQMDNWHLISEFRVNIVPFARVILSAELQTYPQDSKPDHEYEGCLDLSHRKIQSYMGFREQNLFAGSAVTSFFDLNYYLQRDFIIGTFFDFVNSSVSDNYFKFGIQTSFILK